MVGDEFSIGNTTLEDIKSWPRCTYIEANLNPSETRIIGCSEVHQGRYVSIYYENGSSGLTLCEVEVFGSKIFVRAFLL